MNFLSTTSIASTLRSAHRGKLGLSATARPRPLASTLSQSDLQRIVAQMID